MKRFFFLFFLLPACCFSQNEDNSQKLHYKNGNLKSLTVEQGRDTFQIIKYYANGKIKDSLWLRYENNEELIFGTEKSFYKNGRLSSITYHHSGWDNYTLYSYYENGVLERFVQSPTGIITRYNKKGVQIRYHDYNKRKEIFVSKQYKNQTHLAGTSYVQRIKNKKAKLTLGDIETKKIKSGALVSLYVRGNKNKLTHCQIEGFTKDSIYISKFQYNAKYNGESDSDILSYQKTFALGLNQLDTLFYSPHTKHSRTAASVVAYAAGSVVLLIPVLYTPFFIKAAVEQNINASEAAVIYGGGAAIGLPLIGYGNYLARSMVPKKYDMRHWKIVVKD